MSIALFLSWLLCPCQFRQFHWWFFPKTWTGTLFQQLPHEVPMILVVSRQSASPLFSGCWFWALPDQQSLVIFLLSLSYQPVGVLVSKSWVRNHWSPKRLLSYAFFDTQSSTTRNNNGERRHPCLTPVLTLMGGLGHSSSMKHLGIKSLILNLKHIDDFIRHTVMTKNPPQSLPIQRIKGFLKIHE